MSYGVLACPKCGEPADFGVSMPRFSTRPEHAVDRITCRRCGLMVIPEELVLDLHRNVLRGGGAPAIPSTPPPAHIPIGRTARGTATGATTDGSGAYALSSSITVGTTGSTLVVFIYRNESLGAITGLSWNGAAMSNRSEVTSANNIVLTAYVLHNSTAGTGALIADDSFGAVSSWGLIVTEVTGAALSSFDKQSSGTGTSTAPSSGNTPVTSQADELLIGAVWRANATITGILSGSFTQGQTTTRAGNSMEECYRIVAATGAYAAAKTACANSAWDAVIVSLKEN